MKNPADEEIKEWLALSKLDNNLRDKNHVSLRRDLSQAFTMIERWDLRVTDCYMHSLIKDFFRKELQSDLKISIEEDKIWNARISYIDNIDPYYILLVSEDFVSDVKGKAVSSFLVDATKIKRLNKIKAFW